MPRAKKKALASEAHQPDTSFNPSEFDKPADAPAAVVNQVAEHFAMPQEQEAAHVNGHAAQVQRRPHYAESGHKDYVVGARLTEHRNPYLSIIKFDEKPSKEVTGLLRDAGFNFSSENQEWTRPIHFETRIQDRLHAERAFADVRKQLRTERGIGHDYGHAVG